jgi:FAD/FMN-containing dehydrogenase
MEPITATTDLFESLRRSFSGQVSTPTDPEYAPATQAFNLAVEQRPLAVVRPESVEDVVAVVRFAAANGLRVAPQRTGHNAGPLAPSLGSAILLRTDELTDFEIDVEARRARVSAGTKWAEVCDAVSEAGLACLSGSSRDVGIVGYSLGGGLGFMGRKHGLAANSITAVELVTADGELRRVDADSDPELFWALRGGGGNFGVVTALEFELFDEPEIYAGAFFFEFERTSEVLHAWHDWTKTGLPDEITSVGRVMQFPPFEEVPEPLRGKSFAIVEAVFTGSREDGEALLRPLRELGPAMETFEMVPSAALGYLHMDPDDPLPAAMDHMVLGDLPSAAIDDLVAVTGPGSGSPLVSVELRHCGGALARTPENSGAATGIAGEYLMFAVGGLMTPEMGAAVEAQLALVGGALAAHRTGSYSNFEERPGRAGELYDAETTARLAAARKAVDPDGIFLANHEFTSEAA